jgi:hypothetical protein
VELSTWWAVYGQLVISLLLGGVLSALINWYFVWLVEKPKRLAYEVLSRSRIMSDRRYSLPPLSVLHKLRNPNVTLIRIGNAGKQPIVSEDFRGSHIEISFEPAGIVSRNHTNSQNSGISLDWTADNGQRYTGVTPDLLNPGEWFELQFLTSGDPAEPKISARLAGQTHEIGDVRKIEHRRTFSVLAVILFAGTLIGGWNPFLDVSNPNTVTEIFGAVCIGALIATSIISTVTPDKRIWKRPEAQTESASAR